MTKVLVVTGSARPNSANINVVELVKTEFEARGATVEVANLKELALPYFEGVTVPSAEDFEITNQAVQHWSDAVKGADAVVFVAPEYNHGLSAIQKNAIDWLFNEWTDKPVAFVAYGWYAGAHTLAQLQEISTVIKWKPVEKSAGLQFTKDIELDGSSIDGGLATQIVGETLDLLV